MIVSLDTMVKPVGVTVL